MHVNINGRTNAKHKTRWRTLCEHKCSIRSTIQRFELIFRMPTEINASALFDIDGPIV